MSMHASELFDIHDADEDADHNAQFPDEINVEFQFDQENEEDQEFQSRIPQTKDP